MIKLKEYQKLNKKELEQILKRNPLTKSGPLETTVASIIKSVAKGGDKSVQKYNKKWGSEADPLLYGESDFVTALSQIDPEIKNALGRAAREIRNFHRKQIRKNIRVKNMHKELGMRFVPHERVAVYVPGGKALYPSTVLMGVIPARLAGVKEVSLLTPAGEKGKVSDIILAAAALADADNLYAAGGAQAIAAAAYGTAELKKVSMIVGPGNNFVNQAKWQVSTEENIAIDSPAGPSEVLIIAEDLVEPSWIAADLLSQAEHGEDSAAILCTTSKKFAQEVEGEIKNRLSENSRRNSIKKSSISNYSYILLFDSLDQIIHFSNRYAPEHLQIITRNDNYVLDRIQNAGSVFVGPYSPVAAGDYCSGTNHILPTSGMAGQYFGLSVESFYKRFTYQKLGKKALASLADTIDILSTVEGLDEEHGRSVNMRLDSQP